MSTNGTRERTCCFTGHRKLPAQDLNCIMAELEKTITVLINRGVRYFGAGGVWGFDALAAKAVLKLHQQYPHIRLILVLPCHDQAKKWPAREVAEYERIKAQADTPKLEAPLDRGGGHACYGKAHLGCGSTLCRTALPFDRAGPPQP